jgi:hypothetical protein
MRSYQVFASMSNDEAVRLLRALAEQAPGAFANAVAVAAVAMKARPVYLQKQPFERRAEHVRRALARVAANPMASEILAAYFLECRKPLLIEWLDTVGLAHEEGMLSADAPEQPKSKDLGKAIDTFLAAGDDADRPLLLHAFAAQDAIEWPDLETRLAALG